MSKGSFNPKIRFQGQMVCPVARLHTHTHTHTHTHISYISRLTHNFRIASAVVNILIYRFTVNESNNSFQALTSS